MKIHFKLRQQGKTNPTIVMHVFDARFKQRKFMYSTSISIDKEHWDRRRNRAKNLITKSKEHDELNKHLDHLQQTVISYLSERHKSNVLSREELKQTILLTRTGERIDSRPVVKECEYLFVTWEKIISESKTSNGESITEQTKRQKRQTLKLVKRFSTTKSYPLSFTKIDMNFYHALDSFMKEGNLSANSRGKHFKEIKSLCREALDRDLLVNLSFQKKSFKVIRNATDNTYLNDEEIKKLIRTKLPSSLELHRDVFIMACFVGARHSDWNQIQRSNITIENGREILKMKQTKTGEIVHVPVHPLVAIILNKYNGHPPKVISNAKFNEALKDICQKADLGKVVINGEEVEKWSEVTTHTARRSFATNAYLSKSLEVYQIMKCTGHKTEASFLLYLKLNGKDYAMQAAESSFFNNTSWANLLIAS